MNIDQLNRDLLTALVLSIIAVTVRGCVTAPPADVELKPLENGEAILQEYLEYD